jgi:GNAT superfamily N-acetyltransferase
VLSTGEKFRTTVARALAESSGLVVMDEFTSVVDRTVAQIGSAAVAKMIRRRGGQFIAVTCHEDVEPWLDPDWVYQPHLKRFQWRSLQGRPAIELEICRVNHSAWSMFAPYHYLSATLNPSAWCFVAFLGAQPTAFTAWLPFVGKIKGGAARRGHRTVCLPEFQGIGIGSALCNCIAAMWRGLGFQAVSSTGHPGYIRGRLRSADWMMTRATAFSKKGYHRSLDSSRACTRLVASFRYVGTPMNQEHARRLLDESWSLTVS